MKITTINVFGFEAALRGMRNPMNSWNKNDSLVYCDDTWTGEKIGTKIGDGLCVYIGENDLKLAQNLIKAGNEHRKFLRMIHVQADFDMPRYWWSEFDTYHFNTKNSCSTMHKLLNNNNPITKDLFVYCDEDEDIVDIVVNRLENLRKQFKENKDADKNKLLVRAKRLLMEGFLQMRTVDTNYEEIRTMYFQRDHHPLREEWVDTFCKWVESLPYAKELILYEG